MKSLAIVPFLLGAIGALAKGPSRRALIVGNGSYTPLPQLAQSARNAETVANALRDICFDVTSSWIWIRPKWSNPSESSKLPFSRATSFSSTTPGMPCRARREIGCYPSGSILRMLVLSPETLIFSPGCWKSSSSKPGPRLVVIDAATDVPDLKPVAIGEGLANSIVGEQTLLCYSTRPGVGAKPQPGPGPGPFVKSLRLP